MTEYAGSSSGVKTISSMRSIVTCCLRWISAGRWTCCSQIPKDLTVSDKISTVCGVACTCPRREQKNNKSIGKKNGLFPAYCSGNQTLCCNDCRHQKASVSPVRVCCLHTWHMPSLSWHTSWPRCVLDSCFHFCIWPWVQSWIWMNMIHFTGTLAILVASRPSTL